jgi:hypothetical protein
MDTTDLLAAWEEACERARTICERALEARRDARIIAAESAEARLVRMDATARRVQRPAERRPASRRSG